MSSAYDLVVEITSGQLGKGALSRAMRDFSSELGWSPSYHLIESPFVDRTAKAHLIVEHGLEPSAVITFLDRRSPLSSIQLADQYGLLSISYNNLVDWHLYVEPEKVSYCFNRTKPFTIVEAEAISQVNFDTLSREAFDKVIGRRPSPNLPALDEALIKTISRWKRALAAEMGHAIPNENLSALFNAILFARAVEDSRSDGQHSAVLLNESARHRGTLRAIVRSSLQGLGLDDMPVTLLDESKLVPFDALDQGTIISLFKDFYVNPYAPYKYNFSLMSKHALSRIYEHYSSLLHIEDSPQASFFPAIPEEEWNKIYGSVYTPQFIARFFARFIREQMPPIAFRRIKSVDPACGSGIFLRTLLEFQCDPLQDGVNTETVNKAFDSVLGLDVDENATQATRLSLALLYLSITRKIPARINALTAEAIIHYQDHPELSSSFDVVIVNPPFISTGTQSVNMRQRVAEFMGADAKGRTDMYLPFLKLGLEMLRPGGYGLYVLPHSFLIAKSALTMRRRLARESWIRCLADLSAIRVFGNLGSYIVLLIFEKKGSTDSEAPQAAIIKCQDSVGHALEDLLDGRRVETSSYSVFEVGQQEFAGRDEWIILPPTESGIRRRFQNLPKLGDFAEIREGIITGADDVFVLDRAAVPTGEEEVYIPFLPDRAIARYNVPDDTGRRVFYPFIGGSKLSEQELEGHFPRTWKYLQSKRGKLEKRRPVTQGDLVWWEPVRPRSPQRLLRPKIVSPHLVLLPRFSLDHEGKYAISHGPFIYPKELAAEDDVLRFMLAVLNSAIGYWHISTYSHKYSRGYAMLEPKTLKEIRMPDPTQVATKTMAELIALVNRRVVDQSAFDAETQIEEIIADLYGLSSRERKELGAVL